MRAKEVITKPSLLKIPSSTSLLKHLIDSPALVRAVQALPAPAFSKLVQHVGVEDAGELVALATIEQLIDAFDEDLFHGPRPGDREAFDPTRFVTWLEVLLEAGEEVAARRFAELSEDFVTHAINSLVIVLASDELRDRMREGGTEADRVDKRLESAMSEEIDGYLLVARRPDGWDAVFTLILALDRDHRGLLERILDRCASLSSQLIEDLATLSTVLSEEASLADDVEAEREDRRGRAGYVEPRAARSFLELARTGQGPRGTRDPIARAHFRERAAPAPVPAPPHGPPQPDAAKLQRLIESIADEEPAPRPPARPSLPAARSTIIEALHTLREADARRFDERMEELAFLSNVLTAGATIDGRRFRPSEASEAALATVALGAELEVRARHRSTGRATPSELVEVLKERTADLLFRAASALLVAHGPSPEGFLRDRGELTRAVKHLALRASQASPLHSGSSPERPRAPRRRH